MGLRDGRSRVIIPDVAGVAQLAEHLPCKQVVAGSTPAASSRGCPEGYRSGQTGQTVNLLANAFEGSNPSPSTSCCLIAG